MMIRRIGFLTTLLCTILSQTGCISLYCTFTRQVQVVDAETLEPISGAEIDIRYLPTMLIVNPPDDFSTKTGPGGYASVTMTTFSGLSSIGIIAVEYLPTVDGQTRGRIPASAVRVRNERNQEIWHFALFRAPAPMITIELPADFRGPLLIDFQQDHDWSPGKPFHREITISPNERGVVTIALPASMRQHGEFQAVRSGEDSMPTESLSISRALYDNPARDRVAFRRITFSDWFVVGDQVDWLAFFLQLYDVTPNNGGISIQGKESSREFMEAFRDGPKTRHR